MILMGQKYQIDALHDESSFQLTKRFAYSFDDQGRIGFEAGAGRSMTTQIAELVEIAAITKRLGLSELHRGVLYDCCQFPAQVVVHGPANQGLDPEDFVRYSDGRCRLLEAQRKVTLAMFQPSPDHRSNCSPQCSSYNNCRQFVEGFRLVGLDARLVETERRRNPKDPEPKFDALRVHGQNYWFEESCGKLCSSCRKWYKDKDVKLRKEILANLKDYV